MTKRCGLQVTIGSYSWPVSQYHHKYGHHRRHRHHKPLSPLSSRRISSVSSNIYKAMPHLLLPISATLFTKKTQVLPKHETYPGV